MCGETFEGKSELKAHKRSVHSQLIMNNSIDLAPDMLLLGDASSSDLGESTVFAANLASIQRTLKFTIKTHR